MLPILAGIVSMLVNNGLPKIAEIVTQKGVDYVQEKLGVELKPEMTPQEIEALRAESVKHEEFLITENNKNTADARNMQVEALKQDDKFAKRFVYIFASFWSLVAAVFIFAVTFYSIPETGVRFADTTQGFLLGTVIATILNFFFGSSMGSARKTELLDKK